MNSIIRRLRESRLTESSQEFEYKFDIPWRETLQDLDGDEVHHYNPKYMDYASDIMEAAVEDFNDTNLAKYAREDSRTSDCGIKKMTMDFDKEGNCIITVITSIRLDQEQIEEIINYLEGQMSDGWGEGFEQREIASYKEEDEEWIEDDEDEDGGYYDTVERNIYVFGQFWWYDTTHDYQISLVSTPDDKERPVKESASEAEYICKKVVVDSNGVMEILCYDTVEDEEFEKYIGQVDDPSARKSARLLLRDWKFEVPKDIRNELIGTFGLEDFGLKIEESSLSKQEMIRVLKDEYHKNYNYDQYSYGQLVNIYNKTVEAAKDEEELKLAAEGSKNRLNRKCPECDTLLNDAGKCPVCDDLDSRYNESTIESQWKYWEMPKDYKGPWLQDHFYKEYNNGILGFIYPPFESNNPRLESENHSDYIAMMWDNNKTDVVDEKSFSKMKDARAWLDELGGNTLAEK